MATISFASKLKDDDSLTMPREVIEELGLHPGDEVQLRVEAANGTADQTYYNQVIAELLEEARNVKPEPGKPGNDPQEAEFGEIMKEKYRKQGFHL
jgi:antitoxin component of MazEF toxin-antitoxin module